MKDKSPEIIQIENYNIKYMKNAFDISIKSKQVSKNTTIITFIEETLQHINSDFLMPINLTNNFIEKDLLFYELSCDLKYDLSLYIYKILMNNQSINVNDIIWDNMILLYLENTEQKTYKQNLISLFEQNEYFIPSCIKKLSNVYVKELWIHIIIIYFIT